MVQQNQLSAELAAVPLGGVLGILWRALLTKISGGLLHGDGCEESSAAKTKAAYGLSSSLELETEPEEPEPNSPRSEPDCEPALPADVAAEDEKKRKAQAKASTTPRPESSLPARRFPRLACEAARATLLLACGAAVALAFYGPSAVHRGPVAQQPAEIAELPIDAAGSTVATSTSASPVAADSPKLSAVATASDASAGSVAAAAPLVSALPTTQDTAGPEQSARDQTFTVPLMRQRVPVNTVGGVTFYKSAYFGNIHVGSPPMPFKVVFDTGSGHLILPSTYCHSETCRAHARYRRSKSMTARDIDYDGTTVAPGAPRDQITVSFGTGEVTGVFIEDVVCISPDESAAFAAAPQVDGDAPLPKGCMKLRLIAATEMSESPFKTFHFDGVLGLGLDGLSQAREFNFFDVIAEAIESWGGDRANTFAVFLADSDQEESKITFGGWNEAHLSEPLRWNSVLDPEMGHWAINVRGLRVDNETLGFCREGCKAVVDTGTSLLAVPTAAFPELYELMRHPAQQAGHCTGRGPELHIELDDFTVTLGPQDYARTERAHPSVTPRFEDARNDTRSAHGERIRDDMFCKPMLMSLDLPAPLGPKLFILGEPVLRKYYTVYDGGAKRVGFGRAVHKRTTSAVDYVRSSLSTEDKDYLNIPRSIFDLFRLRRSLR